MTVYNEMTDCHGALSTGDNSGDGAGLTAWRNAKAIYIDAELIPYDRMLGWNISHNIKTTQRIGTMTSTRVKHRISTSRREGTWYSKHAFQTCQFAWWLMQTPATPTQEGVPGAGYNTHTLTKGVTNIPLWYGIHFEREGITGQTLRYDIMGVLPSDLIINCGQSEDNYKATQEITVPFAYLNAGASDLTVQTPRPQGTTGSIWKDWSHVIAGNGGGSIPSGITESGNQLEVDIVNMSIKLHRDIYFGVPDADGYTVGLMLGWDYSVILDVIPTGDLLYTTNRADASTHDIDYVFLFEADSTNDKITFNFDKMCLVPFDEVNDWNSYFEGYSITLEPLDKTSSLTITGIDNLDNTHFENP